VPILSVMRPSQGVSRLFRIRFFDIEACTSGRGRQGSGRRSGARIVAGQPVDDASTQPDGGPCCSREVGRLHSSIYGNLISSDSTVAVQWATDCGRDTAILPSVGARRQRADTAERKAHMHVVHTPLLMCAGAVCNLASSGPDALHMPLCPHAADPDTAGGALCLKRHSGKAAGTQQPGHEAAHAAIEQLFHQGLILQSLCKASGHVSQHGHRRVRAAESRAERRAQRRRHECGCTCVPPTGGRGWEREVSARLTHDIGVLSTSQCMGFVSCGRRRD